MVQIAIRYKYRLVFAGTIIVGVSDDEPSHNFFTEARNVMLTTSGVDIRSIGWRWKFVFTAEIGRPEKVQYIVRDSAAPYEIFMDVLIRGQFNIMRTLLGYKIFYSTWRHQMSSQESENKGIW